MTTTTAGGTEGGLGLLLPSPRRLELAGSAYMAQALRVRDLAELGAAGRARLDRAWAPFRWLCAHEPEPARRRGWCRLALEAIAAADQGDDDQGDDDGWPAAYLARVLRASAPIPADLHRRLSGPEWAAVLAAGEGLGPLDELYAAVDRDAPAAARSGGGGDGATSWPRLYCALARAYPGLTPAAFGELLLPQVRVLAAGGECEPGAPPGGDEHALTAILLHRERFLSEDD
jgi:hypothetical protein